MNFLAEKTPQEVFDHVYAHIMKQGPCTDDDWNCLYNGENGKSCAAGCLVPEHDRPVLIENLGWGRQSHRFFGPHDALIEEMQSAHDDSSQTRADRSDFETNFDRQMRRIAKEFGLQVPE